MKNKLCSCTTCTCKKPAKKEKPSDKKVLSLNDLKRIISDYFSNFETTGTKVKARTFGRGDMKYLTLKIGERNISVSSEGKVFNSHTDSP